MKAGKLVPWLQVPLVKGDINSICTEACGKFQDPSLVRLAVPRVSRERMLWAPAAPTSCRNPCGIMYQPTGVALAGATVQMSNGFATVSACVCDLFATSSRSLHGGTQRAFHSLNTRKAS